MNSDMRSFVVVQQFTIGAEKGESRTIDKGTNVQYDGHNLYIEGDTSGISFPRFNRIIDAKWVTPQGEDATYTPQSANISVRPSTPNSPAGTKKYTTVTTMKDEHFVGSYKDRTQTHAPAPSKIIEVQTGIPVISLKKNANVGRVDEVQGRATTLVSTETISKVNAVIKSASDVGVSELEGITFKNENVPTRTGGTAPTKFSGRVTIAQEEGQVVGTVHAAKKEPAAPAPIPAPAPVVAPVKRGPGRPPKAKVAAEPTTAAPSVINERIAAVKLMCPEFPDWPFTSEAPVKLAEIKKYGKQPTILRAIFAAESDDFRVALKTTYPKFF
jgi:hypothetical protein